MHKNDIIKALLLSKKPLIAATKTSYHDSYLGHAMEIAEHFNGREGCIIVVPAWTWRKSGNASHGKDRITEFQSLYPKIRLVVFAADDLEIEAISETGAEYVKINQNAFLDEKLFLADFRTKKKYDAIYVAQMMRFKRHYLAKLIENIAIVYYGNDFGYLSEVEELFPNGYFPNGTVDEIQRGTRGKGKFLNQREMNDLYAQSSVGLCLSEAEGTMWACVEYLLSGLPVVSTPAIGGRMEFLDSHNSIICDADEISVKDSVEFILNNNIDRLRIRREVLEKIYKIREDFYSFMDQLRSDFGGEPSGYRFIFEKEIFKDKLWKNTMTRSELDKEISFIL